MGKWQETSLTWKLLGQIQLLIKKLIITLKQQVKAWTHKVLNLKQWLLHHCNNLLKKLPISYKKHKTSIRTILFNHKELASYLHSNKGINLIQEKVCQVLVLLWSLRIRIKCKINHRVAEITAFKLTNLNSR